MATWTLTATRIWYATFGAGPQVSLLHRELGHSGASVCQLLRPRGCQAIDGVLIDSGGGAWAVTQGARQTRPVAVRIDLASDAVAVIDTLRLDNAAFVTLERRRLHRPDSCADHAGAQPRRLLLRVQHGSQWREAVRAEPIIDRLLRPVMPGITLRCQPRQDAFQAFVDVSRPDAVGRSPNYCYDDDLADDPRAAWRSCKARTKSSSSSNMPNTWPAEHSAVREFDHPAMSVSRISRRCKRPGAVRCRGASLPRQLASS